MKAIPIERINQNLVRDSMTNYITDKIIISDPPLHDTVSIRRSSFLHHTVRRLFKRSDRICTIHNREFSSRTQYSFVGNPLTVSQQYALYQNTYSSNRYRRGSYSSCAYCINFDIILAQCYLLSEVYSRKTDQPTNLKISLYAQSNPGLRHL